MESIVYMDVKPGTLEEMYQRFGGTSASKSKQSKQRSKQESSILLACFTFPLVYGPARGR
jgi:hypothetical protein